MKVISFLFLSAFSMFAHADFYCCMPAGSSKTCSDRLPPVCIGLDYTIKNKFGIIKTVLSSPIDLKNSNNNKNNEEEIKQKRRMDKLITDTYSSMNQIQQDIKKTELRFDPKILEIENEIDVLKKKEDRNELKHFSTIAKGSSIKSSEDLFDIKMKIDDKEKDLENLKKLRDTEIEKYQMYLKRFKELTSK